MKFEDPLCCIEVAIGLGVLALVRSFVEQLNFRGCVAMGSGVIAARHVNRFGYRTRGPKDILRKSS